MAFECAEHAAHYTHPACGLTRLRENGALLLYFSLCMGGKRNSDLVYSTIEKLTRDYVAKGWDLMSMVGLNDDRELVSSMQGY